MIDLHCHILPGVDDGAKTLDEALDMADIAVESGVTCICATPHTNQEGDFKNFDSEELNQKFLELRYALQNEKIPIDLLRGAEAYADENIIRRMDDKSIISINNSDYYLIEFNFDEANWYIEQILASVLDMGKIPVIAHPERYYCVQDKPSIIFDWISQGSLTQLNKGSILGRFGTRAERCAHILLQHNLVTCIASDAHSPFVRTTDFTILERYLRNHFSEDVIELYLKANPYAIIHNMYLPEQLPLIPFDNKRFIW